MGIDFHDPSNAGTYASRSACPGWMETIATIANPLGLQVADIGCGGGIYTAALAQMGATHVTGIDFSAQMIQDATHRARNLAITNASFIHAEATHTGLANNSMDLVLQRALIHHLPSLTAAFAEARRILSTKGALLIQDRRVTDILAPPSKEHFRGWFFEMYPHLVEFEAQRRPDTDHLETSLLEAGFTLDGTHSIAEERRTYANTNELRADLLARTGRSILHELTDEQLERLATRICDEVQTCSSDEPIREIDYWTVWKAVPT